MTQPQTPPGWYPDPHDPNSRRYWDGSNWTQHTTPGAATTPLPAGAVGGSGGGRSRGPMVGVLVGAGVVVVGILALVLFLLVGGDDDDPGTASDDTTTTTEEADDRGDDRDDDPVAPVEIGDPFDDPGGTYTIQVDGGWDRQFAGFPEGVEGWSIGTGDATFGDNVNVLTEPNVPVGLEEYLDRAIANAPLVLPGFEAVDRRTVQGAFTRLGRVEGRATISGIDVAFLQIIAVGGGNAVIATLSTLPERFDAVVAQVEPFLLTLEPTG